MSRSRSGYSLRSTSTVNIADDNERILSLIDSQENQAMPSLMLVEPGELEELGATAASFDINEFINDGSESSSSLLSVRDNDDIQIIEPPAKVRKIDPRGRGRNLDPAWSNFHISNNLPKSQVQCNECGAAVSNKIERLRSHLEKKCMVKKANSVSGRESVPESGTGQEKLDEPSTSTQVQQPSTGSSRVIPKTKQMASSKVKIQSRVSGFIDHMTQKEQNELNMEIGRYIFATNLPFSHVEHPAFKQLIKKIRPASTLPTRRMIGGKILNTIYESVMEEQKDELNGKTVTIMQDGWKTRTSEPVISHSVTTGEKSFFHNAISTEDKKKTGSYCANLLAKSIEEIKCFGADVFAVVTDNCRSMEKMREIISKQYPGIFTYGCLPHLLNLVGKKFTPEDVIDKVQNVHLFFRNHDAAWALLKKKGCARPSITSDTRWNAWIECLEYYVKNQTAMLEVSRNPRSAVNDDVLETLNDNAFHTEVTRTVNYLKPIQVALDSLQRENASLADGVDAWLKLKNHLGVRDADLQDYFDKQFDKALQPVGIAAHMMHPRYRGDGLSPNLIEKGNLFLSEHNPSYVILASQLKCKDPTLFAEYNFSDKLLNSCTATAWWKSQECLEKIDRAAIKLFGKLMALPAGSSDIERHFSALGNIMNARRARLGIEKASKLCLIYKHLAGPAAPGDDGGDWDLPDSEL